MKRGELQCCDAAEAELAAFKAPGGRAVTAL